MKTPICDFVKQYAASGALRLHMPGHKGQGSLGVEALDITEITGADSLYDAAGIIRQSEENASRLFGCPTFYSTEGSSHCIRAMVLLAVQWAKRQGKAPLIAAGRNAHKAFLTAVALLDAPVRWLWGEGDGSYLSCRLTPESLERAFAEEKLTAVYVTSPDYLGSVAEVKVLAEVCHRHGALLLVDNAHGAYLRFLEEDRHPMSLGADLCCDSAHKTLPVLTGGAYLHVRETPVAEVKAALALFGSTSPSYLILQSLDACNACLEGYSQRLAAFLPRVEALKERLLRHGYALYGAEPLKLTLQTKPYGYLGTELAAILEERGMVWEFADPDYLVLMLTPDIGEPGLTHLEKALLSIPRKPAILTPAPGAVCCERVVAAREAALAPSRHIPVEAAVGRVLASPSVGCPPAVPIVLCGERITEEAVKAFRYYGITHCHVME